MLQAKNILAIERTDTLQSQLFPHNSFGFGGNSYTSTLWTLGGADGEKLMFSTSYNRWFSRHIALELQLRYINIFLNRESFSNGSRTPLRRVNTIWGTDAIFMARPSTEFLSGLRLGIGLSLDMITSFISTSTQTYPGDLDKILQAAEYFAVSYLGAIGIVEYTAFTLGNSVDVGARLQVNVQSALTPRPGYIVPYPFSGGLLYGVYVRMNW